MTLTNWLLTALILSVCYLSAKVGYWGSKIYTIIRTASDMNLEAHERTREQAYESNRHLERLPRFD